MDLCSLVNVSSESVSTGSTSSPELRTPEMAKRRRNRKSSSENSDSSQTFKKYKKYANLPEEIAESKRQKVNQQERDRQRLISEVFMELRDLKMPPYVIPGHKSDSKYYLLKSAVCHIKELRQSNEELKTSAYPHREKITTQSQESRAKHELESSNDRASFLDGGTSCQAVIGEMKSETFQVMDGCHGNVAEMSEIQPVAGTYLSILNDRTTASGRVCSASNAIAIAKGQDSEVARGLSEARGEGSMNSNSRAISIVENSLVLNEFGQGKAIRQVNMVSNGQVKAGSQDSVKLNGGRKRQNKSVTKDRCEFPKSLKSETSVPSMDVESVHQMFTSKNQILVNLLNNPAVPRDATMKQFYLQHVQKRESKEIVSASRHGHDFSFSQTSSPATGPQVRTGVTSSLFNMHEAQSTPMRMAHHMLFDYCHNTPGNMGLYTDPHQVPDAKERFRRCQNVQENVSLPSLYFAMVRPSTQPADLYGRRPMQGPQYYPSVSTEINTNTLFNEVESKNVHNVQGIESDSFNIFKNFVSYIST